MSWVTRYGYLAALVADVVDRDDVGVIAKPAHRLGLAPDASATLLIEPLGLNQGECHVAVELGVVAEVARFLPPSPRKRIT